MASPSITSVNSIYMLAITGLYTVPQQLQGFSADDIFDTGEINSAEVVMGLDGKIAAGYVPVAIVQNITLLANSDSNALFEAWWASQRAAQELYFATGIIRMPSVKRSYALTNGVLTGYSPMSDAKKTLQPRKYTITWESALAAPL